MPRNFFDGLVLFQVSTSGSRRSPPTWSTTVKAEYEATWKRWTLKPAEPRPPGFFLVHKESDDFKGFNSSSVCFCFSQVDDATRSTQRAKVKAEFLKTSKCLVEMLKNDKYNGKYFDRTEKESSRLCTKEGWFTCQVWQKLHRIYSTYQKTWIPCCQALYSYLREECLVFHLCDPFRERLIRSRAGRSIRSTRTAAERAGSSSAPGTSITGGETSCGRRAWR